MGVKKPDWKALAKAAAAYAALEDSNRYSLGGVHFFMGRKGLDIAATDGHTLFLGHVDDMTAPEPMGGNLTTEKAIAGADPEMSAGWQGSFPMYAKVTDPARKRARKATLVVDRAGWEDLAKMSKLWPRLVERKTSVYALSIGAPVGEWVLEGNDPDGIGMTHRLAWPAGEPQEAAKGVGVSAIYAQRMANTLVQLGQPARFAVAATVAEPFAAHAAWDGGSASIVVMPCRM